MKFWHFSAEVEKPFVMADSRATSSISGLNGLQKLLNFVSPDKLIELINDSIYNILDYSRNLPLFNILRTFLDILYKLLNQFASEYIQNIISSVSCLKRSILQLISCTFQLVLNLLSVALKIVIGLADNGGSSVLGGILSGAGFVQNLFGSLTGGRNDGIGGSISIGI